MVQFALIPKFVNKTHMFIIDYPSSFGCFVVVNEPDHNRD